MVFRIGGGWLRGSGGGCRRRLLLLLALSGGLLPPHLGEVRGVEDSSGFLVLLELLVPHIEMVHMGAPPGVVVPNQVGLLHRLTRWLRRLASIARPGRVVPMS